MGLGSVIVTFVTSIIFYVLLNSLDVYSDIALAFRTFTFDLGESLLLSGCKVCYNKDDKDIYLVQNNSCQQCLTCNYQFECGASFDFLEQLLEIEKSESCKSTRFGYKYSYISKNFDKRNETCNDNVDNCCVENRRQYDHKNPFKNIDKRVLAFQEDEFQKIRNTLPYDIFVLSARSSWVNCQRVYLEYLEYITKDKTKQKTISLKDKNLPTLYKKRIKRFLYKHITERKEANETEWFFKFRLSGDERVIIDKGFNSNDECGAYITNKLKRNEWRQNNGEICGSDTCLMHLNYLKWSSNISNLADWKERTILKDGNKVGGKTCQILWQYGFASLAPILIHLSFITLVYLEDLKQENATKIEAIFVLMLIYPQTKCLKFLLQFFFHRDEEKLNRAKNEYDDRLGTTEPFMESAIQASFGCKFEFNNDCNCFNLSHYYRKFV